MELIERYLQAVGFWLPKQQKHDIIAELSDDIHAQIEEQEAGLNRKLNETEVEAILKQVGRPVLVANRYLPQECLIGPVLFPVYLFVLKIVMLCCLAPWLLVWIGMLVYSPSFHAAHAGTSAWSSFGSLWGAFWSTSFVSAGVVTIVFAVLERVQAKSRFLEDWNPRKLPPVKNPNQIPRSESGMELAANMFFFGWFATNMSSPIVVNQPDLRITLSPIWAYFFWGLLLLTLVNTALAGANMVNPHWTRARATLRLLSDLAGSTIFCWFLKADILVEISSASVSPERAHEIAGAVNFWLARSFPAAVAVCVAILGWNVYRIVRQREAA
jgi:hypothetical protein